MRTSSRQRVISHKKWPQKGIIRLHKEISRRNAGKWPYPSKEKSSLFRKMREAYLKRIMERGDRG